MKNNVTKKQKIGRVLDLIRKMEQNSFLLPDSWSEMFNMVSRSAHYKTYVGSRGEYNRYIKIEYTKNDEIYNPSQEDCYSITIRKNEIFLSKRLGEPKNEIDIVLDIVESIYKEKISFELMDKEASKKRLRMKEIRQAIKTLTEEFNKLKNELSDRERIWKRNN